MTTTQSPAKLPTGPGNGSPQPSAQPGTGERLRGAIEDRTARVGVIGLGYVGLPLVELFAKGGFPVLGFDLDETKVEHLQAGRSYIGHIDSGRVAALRDQGRFEATTDFARLADVDAVVICVPTPLGQHREPDLAAVIATGRSIAQHLRPGQLIVLESTTYPGTTRDVLRPELEAHGLAAGRDFFLAYSPEREDPGNPQFSAANIPKVVGGWDETSRSLAQSLYGAVVPEVVPVSSCEVAEACKILENTYRAVNIALVNELKVVFDRMGIDVWEVIDAAKTKPFGFQAFYPGPGLGGHCLAGSETARVRGHGLDTVLPLADLFERFRDGSAPWQLGDVEVLEPSGLETLSIDPETGKTGWKAVSHLFRRQFRGTMVEIRLGGNRTIRTTDRHPMLIVSDDRIVIREARDLKAGDRVPMEQGVSSAAEAEGADPRIDLLATLPTSLVDRLHIRHRDVPWSHHEALLKRRDGWTIRDSIRKDSLSARRYLEIEAELGFERDQLVLSSSPVLLAQVDSLLQEMGLQPTREKGKPHLLAGREALLRLMPLFSGEKGDRLGPLEAARLRPGHARTAQTWSEGRSLAVVGVTPSPADEPVFSLEVPGTHTFATTGGVFVHNCIPIDPFYLTWAARRYGLHTRFIELAGEINTAMPHHVIDRVASALNDRGRAVKGSRVLVLGAAYKADVDDCRESPAVELMELLQDRGASVTYHDPHVPTLPPLRGHAIRLESVPLSAETLAAQDCVLIATPHKLFDWDFIVRNSLLVVDTRGATRGSAPGAAGRIVTA